MENKSSRVVITGLGGICAVGCNVEEIYKNIVDGVIGVSEITLFNGEKLKSHVNAELPIEMPYRTKEIEEKSRMECMVVKTLEELLSDANLDKEYIKKLYDRCVLSMATSVGSNAHIIEYIDDLNNGVYIPERLAYYPHYVYRNVIDTLGVSGGYYLNNSACSAGTTAAAVAFSKIMEGEADMAVVIGVDPMTEFSTYGFNSMQNISTTVCKPLDEKRDGINLGEACSAFIFESYESAMKRHAKIYAEVCGYHIGNDAYHATSPDPTGDGAYNTMKEAIKQAGIQADQIDYINIHGTATSQNDSMEIKAMERLFADVEHDVYVSSTKSMTGHCLAAAGSIELLLTVLAVKNNVVYGNPTTDNPEFTEHIKIVGKETIETRVDYAISNSFAFGGNSSSIVVGKVKE